MAKLDQININGTTYEMVPEIAPLFDNTKAYAIGDCVIKDAKLYRFTAAHAAGAWIGTDAEEVIVGEELTCLKADLNTLEVDYSDTSLWKSGGITAAEGKDSANGNRIRTGYISRVINRVSPANGYKVAIYAYSSSDVYIGVYDGNGYRTSALYWYTSTVNLGEIPSEYKLRVVVSKDSESSISISDATNISFEGYTDISLSKSGKAADAKAVGDEITNIKEDVNDIDERVSVLETGGSDDTTKPISAYSTFEIGEFGNKNKKNRITSVGNIAFNKIATLIINDGFKANIQIFEGGVYKKSLYWVQRSFVVPADKQICILIARVTEDASEVADIDEFTSNVTVKTIPNDYANQIEGIDNILPEPITRRTMFQHGEINFSAYLFDRYYRVCTGEHVLHFDIDTTFVIASGFNLTAYYFIDGAYSSTSGQQYGRFTIPANSDAKLTIRRNTEVTSEIADIDEFTSAVSVETPLYNAGKQANRLSDIKAMKLDTILDYGTFTNGVLVNGEINKTQLYRVCMTEPVTFDYDLTLHIDRGFYIQVHYFNEGAFSRNENHTVLCTIPAGTTFSLHISRNTNDTSERASIDEFTSKVTVEPKLLKKINELSETKSAFDRINSLAIPNIASYSTFVNGRIVSGNNETTNYLYRVSSVDIVVFAYDVTVYIATNFIAQVWYFENGVYTTSTGWIQGSIAISAGTEVKFEIRRQSEVTSEIASIDEFTAQLTVVSALTAKLTESAQYHADGDALDVKRHGYNVERLFACPAKRSQGWPQGMAIHNGIIAQFCSAPDDSMHLINLSDGTVITTLTDTHSGHGNTAVFSDEYYDANDEFPLCYVSTGTVCNVVRIERTGVTLIRTINTDDIEHSGYQVSYTIDKATNTLWGIGYYVNNWQQRDGNHMLFSQWDLSNMTEVESGVFKPAYIGGFTMPYIGGAVQGIRFFNNRLWICQQDTAEDPQVYTNIFVMDTDKHRYVSAMSEFPNPIRNYESESIEFVLNDAGDKYDIILLTTEHYYRVTFN